MIKLNPEYKLEVDQTRSTPVNFASRANSIVSETPSSSELPKTTTPQAPNSNRISTRDSLFDIFQAEISRISLLTAKEETSLVKSIFLFRQAYQRLLLKDPDVLTHLANLLSDWQAKRSRLDSVCNIALSETKKRKTLEPALKKAIPQLRKISRRLHSAESITSRRSAHFEAIRLVEALCIRPKSFESAPSNNPIASKLLFQYDRLCQQLTKANLRLVAKTARQICGQSSNLMDMIQEGTQGLMHAVVKFDHSRNLRFSTYAVSWIRQYIYSALGNADRNIRIPDSFRNKGNHVLREIERAQLDLESTTPDSYEVVNRVSAELNLKPDLILKHLRFKRNSTSLDNSVRDGGSNLGTCLSDSADSPFDIATNKEHRELTQAAIQQSLNARERKVITLRYGLSDGHDRSFAEVGKIMGITRERVRQIEKPALEKLGRLSIFKAM